MNRSPVLIRFTFACVVSGFCLVPPSFAADPVTLNTTRTFPEINQLPEWEQHTEALRLQVQLSCGLWPMPERTPLNARIYDKIERSDYSIEKVVIETHPGVFLAGNLFRPIGKGRGPYPGVLNPHGHWSEGRMVHNSTGSVFARCINFAKLGMVAFAYDMVGYNDTIQFSPRNADGTLRNANFKTGHDEFAQAPSDQLWGISLMGLQTWNSIRALDFLESLEDVDPERLAITGASGGGTQTFMLGAIDDRLAVQVPAVMVSHTMQGGCWCENAPGLRIHYSNMEIAAAAAPRPQMLVAATGDWTKTTMEVEGPHIRSIYELLGASQDFRFKIFDYPHNYNRTSREAVYAFLVEQLLNRAPQDSLPEQEFRMENPKTMRVLPEGRILPGSITRESYKEYVKNQVREQVAALWPSSPEALPSFKESFSPVYRTVLQLPADPQSVDVRVVDSSKLPDKTRVSNFEIVGTTREEPIKVRIYQPRRAERKVVVLTHPLGISHSADHAGDTFGFARSLLDQGVNVVVYDGFQTGVNFDVELANKRDHNVSFFTTYNRTDLQEHVADLVNVCAFVRSHLRKEQLILCGRDSAGIAAMLAAPAADAVVADAGQLDMNDDVRWASQSLLIPAIHQIGEVTAPLILAAPNPVFVHNTAGSFKIEPVSRVYPANDSQLAPQFSEERASDTMLLNWIGGL